MDKYDVVMQIEKLYSTLLSISRGDSAATDEYALFISENTISELVNAANSVKKYMLGFIKETDKGTTN